MPDRIYRVDKFVVPNGAREEFLDKARRTHALQKRNQVSCRISCWSNPRVPANSTSSP